jgi:hypothetical protein
LVRFDVVFDIIVKVLVSLMLIAGTLGFALLAIAHIAMGAPVWQCIVVILAVVLCLAVCIGTCLSAQGKL